jgi:preprotein translocase subunit YajC
MNWNQWIVSAWLWAQADGVAADGAAADGAAAAANQAPPANEGLLGLLGNPILSLPILGLMFYLMFIRPESKRRDQFKQLLEGLKKNDRVITVSGIYGTVVNVQKNSEDVTLRIDESNNTRIRVTRTSIARIITDDEGKGGATDDKANS